MNHYYGNERTPPTEINASHDNERLLRGGSVITSLFFQGVLHAAGLGGPWYGSESVIDSVRYSCGDEHSLSTVYIIFEAYEWLALGTSLRRRSIGWVLTPLLYDAERCLPVFLRTSQPSVVLMRLCCKACSKHATVPYPSFGLLYFTVPVFISEER